MILMSARRVPTMIAAPTLGVSMCRILTTVPAYPVGLSASTCMLLVLCSSSNHRCHLDHILFVCLSVSLINGSERMQGHVLVGFKHES